MLLEYLGIKNSSENFENNFLTCLKQRFVNSVKIYSTQHTITLLAFRTTHLPLVVQQIKKKSGRGREK